MMRNFKILILSITSWILLSCDPGQSKNIETQGEEKVQWKFLQEDNYEIKYPSDWELNTSGQMGTSFAILSPAVNPSDKFRENVNLMIQDLSTYDLDLDAYVILSEEQVKTMVTDGTIILSERQNIGGNEFHKIMYTGKQGIYDLKFEQYYWLQDKQAYILTLTCEESEFDNYQNLGEEIINSFNFNN